MFNFEEELKKLPHTPGVYLMHNKTDEIIYVGKAIDLYNRVHQYFQAGYKRSPKIEKMVSHIAWFEYIICESEIEALVLECNLIKEHKATHTSRSQSTRIFLVFCSRIRCTGIMPDILVLILMQVPSRIPLIC